MGDLGVGRASQSRMGTPADDVDDDDCPRAAMAQQPPHRRRARSTECLTLTIEAPRGDRGGVVVSPSQVRAIVIFPLRLKQRPRHL